MSATVENANQAFDSSDSKTSVESASTVSPSMQTCPDDFLTPREMIGFLRAAEEQTPVPSEVLQHLESCRVCAEDWAFLQVTDPALRVFRESRVPLLIRSVLEEESFERASNSQVVSQLADRESDIREMEQHLSGSRGRNVLEDGWTQSILSEDLSIERVFSMLETIQQIEQDKRRFESATQLASLFAARVRRAQERGQITMDIFDSLMCAQSDSIDVGTLNVDKMVAVAFIASLPQTSFFRQSPVLERTEKGILFHRRRLAQLRSEFDQIRMMFETPSIAVQYAR